jgi:hypothetical protein
MSKTPPHLNSTYTLTLAVSMARAFLFGFFVESGDGQKNLVALRKPLHTSRQYISGYVRRGGIGFPLKAGELVGDDALWRKKNGMRAREKNRTIFWCHGLEELCVL